jgi:hypothetical protein
MVFVNDALFIQQAFSNFAISLLKGKEFKKGSNIMFSFTH